MKVGVVSANTSPPQQNKACCRVMVLQDIASLAVSTGGILLILASYLASSMVLCEKECGSIAICVPLYLYFLESLSCSILSWSVG